MAAHTSVNPACPCWALSWHCQDNCARASVSPAPQGGGCCPLPVPGSSSVSPVPPSPLGDALALLPGTGRCGEPALPFLSRNLRASTAAPSAHGGLGDVTLSSGDLQNQDHGPPCPPRSPHRREQPTSPRGTRGSLGCGCHPGWHGAGARRAHAPTSCCLSGGW